MRGHVVILDYTLSGHHFSFACQFTKSLLSLGYRVTCLIPGWECIQQWVQVNCHNQASFFSGANIVRPHYPAGSRLRRMIGAIRRWWWFAKQIRKVESDSGVKVDLVFFAMVDSEVDTFIPPVLLSFLFSYYWSGLYFHPYHLRVTEQYLKRPAVWRDHDGFFLSHRCLAVALHDSSITEAFSRRIHKPVFHFPETADTTAPLDSHPLATHIRSLAGSRLVVGMIGCEPHKGTLNLVRAARMADPQRFFFAFIGIFPREYYLAENLQELLSFFDSKPQNVYTHFHPLQEGAEYNTVFSTFDIPYLVYDNFISSSNRLTKAAFFEKLVLAQDNYCVGADVKNYDLGEVIPPGNPESVVQGLERLARRIDTGDYPYENWKKYRDLNSEVRLTECFRELTDLLP